MYVCIRERERRLGFYAHTKNALELTSGNNRANIERSIHTHTDIYI